MFLFSCGKDTVIDDKKDQLLVFGTCEGVPAKGRLSESAADSTITYITSSGGKIVMDHKRLVITITHKDYINFRLQFWGSIDKNGKKVYGGNHENLNGKHIEDRESNRRSLIFPDGAKITMIAIGYELLSVTIYDGQECHHINTACNNMLEYSSATSTITQQLDDAEPDGETGTFEITATGLLFYNIYTETTLGVKVEKHVPLGEIFKDRPTTVNDYYDDP